MRGLVISWEYPPIIEGGLARHVRKLSEQLVAQGVEVHVLTRGGDRLGAREERHGVIVHRLSEPAFPRDVTAMQNGIDPADLEPVAADLAGLRARYARPGAARHVLRFDWAEVARQTHALYARLT